jgi:hypothetical protein
VQALVTPDEPAPARTGSVPDPMAKRQKQAAAPEPKEPEPESMGEVDGLAVQALWPLGIVAAGGGLFALYKLDPGMEPLFLEAVKVQHHSPIYSLHAVLLAFSQELGV